jgi:hypothetical protein
MKEVEVKVKEERSPALKGTKGLAPLSSPSMPALRAPRPETALISSFIHPFDLSQAPLLRVGLIKIEKEKHILMVDMHHIITDGFSNQVLAEEFDIFYNGHHLPPLEIQYKDFSQWRDQHLTVEELERQAKFWQEEFAHAGEIPILNLPTDFPRPALRDSRGNYVFFEIPGNDLEKLKKLAAVETVTMFTLLFTLYNVFLSRLTGQEDVVVGTVAAGRRHADLEPIIGMFVNTLALRNYPKETMTFKEFLREVKQRTLKAIDNQDYQFENLVERVLPHRDISRNPLFDTMFTYAAGTAGKEQPASRLKIAPYEREDQGTQTKFDLVLAVREIGEQLAFTFYYRTGLFKKDTIQRFVNYFQEVIAVAAANVEVKLGAIALSHDLSMTTAHQYKSATGDFQF